MRLKREATSCRIAALLKKSAGSAAFSASSRTGTSANRQPKSNISRIGETQEMREDMKERSRRKRQKEGKKEAEQTRRGETEGEKNGDRFN